VKAGRNQQQCPAGKTQRSIEVRGLPKVVKRDLDRGAEAKTSQHGGCEPTTRAPPAPPFDPFKEDVATDGDDGDDDQRDREREGDVHPVQTNLGLQKVGQLAQHEQYCPGERENDAERRGAISRRAHRRAPWIGDPDETRRST
jgi:hypothetical protein